MQLLQNQDTEHDAEILTRVASRLGKAGGKRLDR